MKIYKKFLIIFLLILTCISIFGQNDQEENYTLPRNYRDFYLDMDEETFKTTRDEISYIAFQPDLDLTMYEQDKNYYIAYKKPYFNKIIFYFFKGKLVEMIFYYNSDQKNVFENFNRLKEKHGKCSDMDSTRFKWEDDKTIYYLERINILKVIDKEFINSFKEEQEKINNLIEESEDIIYDNF